MCLRLVLQTSEINKVARSFTKNQCPRGRPGLKSYLYTLPIHRSSPIIGRLLDNLATLVKLLAQPITWVDVCSPLTVRFLDNVVMAAGRGLRK